MNSKLQRHVRQLLAGASAWIFVSMLATSYTAAATLFESGTLGPTGIPRSEITGGSNVSPFVFVGVRFHLDQPVITTQIGGHFVKNTGANPSFFGALVALADENDFPDSGNLSTPDVVGTTLLSFPEPSNEVFGAVAKPLPAGWYAVVFGSGLFGAAGSGVALNNGVDVGEPAYIAFQPLSGIEWTNLEGFLSNFRFAVQGRVVPEPTTTSLMFIVALPFILSFESQRNRRLIMNRVFCVILAALGCFAIDANTALGDIIFETGTLGPTGIPREDVTNQVVLGANLNSNAFNGVRFELSRSVLTSQIGGHFVGTPNSNETLFGTIIALNDKDDFPNSIDLSSSDVRGTSLLDFPEPSDVVFGSLELSLPPGWYALVFGSGLFGSLGDGAALLNNTDVGMQSYFGFLRGFGWGNRDPGTYFVIKGTIVPEVSSLVLVLVASCVMVFVRVDRLRRGTRRVEL